MDMVLIENTPNIDFYAQDTTMLSIREDGFYVRGVKVEQDENEARAVYDAFSNWLIASGVYSK